MSLERARELVSSVEDGGAMPAHLTDALELIFQALEQALWARSVLRAQLRRVFEDEMVLERISDALSRIDKLESWADQVDAGITDDSA